MSSIYLASSWRNLLLDAVLHILRENGHEVFDFRNPPDGSAFSFSSIDTNYQRWSLNRFTKELRDNPTVRHAFEMDRLAIERCDVLVLVLPCGKSAHMELGYASGLNKRTVIYSAGPTQPELLYGLAARFVSTFPDLLAACVPGGG